MEYTEIMVRYGELSTKGRNRKAFINQLGRNVRNTLHAFPNVKVQAHRDRMHLKLNGEPSQPIIAALKPVFGIQTFSPAIQVEKELSVIYQTAIEMVKERYEEGKTFKITTKRADREFPLDTRELNREIGHAVIEAIPGIQAQMKQPDIDVRVDIRHNGAFLSSEMFHGAGGLPVGSSGKSVLMLSGGIDSPVAGYLAMKRGVELEMVHFYSPPYTSEAALNKAKDLTVKLTPYVGSIQFITVPFTEIQEAIKKEVPPGYLMTITRRFMLRLTDAIREQRKALAIFNGESLGQVASQTLESMVAINDVTNTPILRPLISTDKTEIIKLAEEIDTFDLAIQPFEDCCTIFAPPQPKTKPKLEKCIQYEQRLDVEGLIERALAGITIEEINSRDQFLQAKEEDFTDLL
ncbi:tRNA 4-thiouridine(8) synthase ThiI [Vagococcus lutrae]|uniref:Probable tRNA sulfurtransferase n=1 Tax=Vagococcus lutrae TaxID=81947 RepID=A0AAE9XF68_9ENTE|nr:tRNA uracil 4-sulfurtransferase ThiI [Vagococcus lutrae]MCO7151077.1 tRNA 4-thiouridine(8) synthase ThiI [Vagococcus lutrae]MDT2807632.1 tRNA 4-thiouridine(8) synthase ThiI [Vagococcus lutrae]MDT2842409.1 tRNA 4-thiouridine(8) synthase ThiI [Vagococcus lutrae]MDY3705654.1 tRNA uracil 4-sulfurtransferase ThiI [Vagococcus lutrae]QZN89501.1 tRNA 4-thiouridine(8) synthase ThiI [Vagococcus lutrae]